MSTQVHLTPWRSLSEGKHPSLFLRETALVSI